MKDIQDIVERVVSSNSKKRHLLAIPDDVKRDISEKGLDSLTIMRQVVAQFPGLLSGRDE